MDVVPKAFVLVSSLLIFSSHTYNHSVMLTWLFLIHFMAQMLQ